ncbi:uncharacterized protein N7484_006051 [Penicillium longicatenatum]|uniref:uncharacterized protein n=1 Tax=Penicillium longicatenatum TaxID=1561947 RepID=UPI002546FEA7|nr:uncharacterized protein N7484_006051 [Penicillium longicatenatum]KAJ5643544.1 hypothetical protein N7484_006051 [Penicillium longicatenatum]
MRILDPQSAVLTNIEVLAYLTANPPRRSPDPPQNADRWVPSPDLRDHNTVVKEIHNYVTRISPHILKYPRYTPRPTSSQSASAFGTMRPPAQTSASDNNDLTNSTAPPRDLLSEQTPMDLALRDLITQLKPFGLTKAEVVMILNLGVGVTTSTDGENGEEMANGDGEMEVDEDGNAVNGEGGEEEDFGAMAIFESVVEEREQRISDEDVQVVLGIIREVLTEHYGS